MVKMVTRIAISDILVCDLASYVFEILVIARIIYFSCIFLPMRILRIKYENKANIVAKRNNV